MPVDALKHKTVMIDRTLPEIRGTLLRRSRLDILELCWMLMNIGADIVEADVELLNKMGRLPEGLAFILKAESLSDLEACGRFGIKRCIMRRSLLEQPGVSELIKKQGLNTALEVRANSIGGIRHLEGLKALGNFEAVSCIRITGLGRADTPEWLETTYYIKGILEKEIDICPDDRFFMGNAIALEAAANGMEYVTASLSGFGDGHRYASLELVLPAMKLQRPGIRKVNPDVLPRLYEQFEKCSHVKIIKNKPVISSDSYSERVIKYPGGLITAGELIDA